MANFQETIEKLLLSDTGDLNELARIAGKNPKTFYIDADFKRSDLTNQDLGQLDTRYADFSRAKLSKMEQALWEMRKRVNTSKLEKNWDEYASSCLALASVLRVFAARAKKAAALDFLDETISVLRDASTVHSKEDQPLKWAEIQRKLADTFGDYAELLHGKDRISPLKNAVTCYRASLTALTIDKNPDVWAATQNRLADSLVTISTYTHPEAAVLLLKDAVTALRSALTIHSKEQNPIKWAAAQNNLGNTLTYLAEYAEDDSALELYGDAKLAYNAALIVRTKEQNPLRWAMTKFNLAITEHSCARNYFCKNSHTSLEAALDNVEEALTMFDPVHMAPNHAKASALRDELLKALKYQ